jgi:hypothetical protein
MFAATVVLLAVMMQQLVAGVAYCFRCWAIGAGTLMVLAQAVSEVAGRYYTPCAVHVHGAFVLPGLSDTLAW